MRKTLEEEFITEFWPKISIKIGRGKARKAYVQARKHTSKDEILDGIPKYDAYEAARKAQSPSDYRPLHPATWLNQERWADEIAVKETTAEKVARLKAEGLL